MSRLIVANLDFESCLSHLSDRNPVKLSKQAEQSARRLGSLLRVFGSDNDRIWLPGSGPLDHCIPPVRGIPQLEIESGDGCAVNTAEEVLAWGETNAVSEMRSSNSQLDSSPDQTKALPLWERIWHCTRPDPETARKLHSRDTHVNIAKELSINLPGRRVIDDLEELDRHLANGGADHSPTAEWILKPMYSATGRDWIRGRGLDVTDQQRAAAMQSFQRNSALVFEPRLDIHCEFGFSLSIDDDHAEVIGVHQLENSGGGQFIAARTPVFPNDDRSKEFAEQSTRQVLRIADTIRAQGFRGICGIDSWLGRASDGDYFAQFLGEINARMTMGWLLHAWISRLLPDANERVGTQVSLRSSTREKPTQHAIPLLNSDREDSLAAWIEVDRIDCSLPPP